MGFNWLIMFNSTVTVLCAVNFVPRAINAKRYKIAAYWMLLILACNLYFSISTFGVLSGGIRSLGVLILAGLGSGVMYYVTFIKNK